MYPSSHFRMKKRGLTVLLLSMAVAGAAAVGAGKRLQTELTNRETREESAIKDQRRYYLETMSEIHNCDVFSEIQRILFQAAESDYLASQEAVQYLNELLHECFPEARSEQLCDFRIAQVDLNRFLINNYSNYEDFGSLENLSGGLLKKKRALIQAMQGIGIKNTGWFFAEPDYTLSQGITTYQLYGHSSRRLRPKEFFDVTVERPAYEFIRFVKRMNQERATNPTTKILTALTDEAHYFFETPDDLRDADANQDGHVTCHEFSDDFLPIIAPYSQERF